MSNLVYHLTTSFCVLLDGDMSFKNERASFDLECNSLSAQADLLSIIIAGESCCWVRNEGTSCNAADAGPAAQNAVNGVGSFNTPMFQGRRTAESAPLINYVFENSTIPENIVKKISIFFVSSLDRGFDTKLVLCCTSSCLRLICSMLNDSRWRQILLVHQEEQENGDGGSRGNLSIACDYLFSLLLALRNVFSVVSQRGPIVASVNMLASLCNRVDVTISLFMQYSAEAQRQFARHCLEMHKRYVQQDGSVVGMKCSDSASVSSAVPSSQFMQHLDAIRQSVDFFTNPVTVPVPSALCSRSAHTKHDCDSASGYAILQGNADQMQKSLQKLKIKNKATVVAPPVAKDSAKKAMNQSTSTWSSSVSKDSKWYVLKLLFILVFVCIVLF
jgi:hypothetical protein